MNTRFDRSPRFSAAGVATGLILLLIVAMAASLAVETLPEAVAALQTASARNGLHHG
jgi:hypothetical protein